MQTHAESENSMTITVSPTQVQATCTYSVKVMNQGRKSEYTIEKLNFIHRFTTMAEMKRSLSSYLKFEVDNFGYIEPGHGLKGRQQWVVQDDDLKQMYRSYSKRSEILLWCIRPSTGTQTQRKRGRSESSDEARPASSERVKRSCSQKIKDVEDIIQQLREKHGQRYSTEQLSCWAHLYNMEKHRSLEDPPNLPFFSGRRGTTQETQSSSPATTCLRSSPSKRVSLRSESIKQLVDWHSLLEKGGISQEQYDDVQQAI